MENQVVDLAETRRSKRDRIRLHREASRSVLGVIEQYRIALGPKYLAFLMAAAMAEQAHLTSPQNIQAGEAWMEEVFLTARQLYAGHGGDDS